VTYKRNQRKKMKAREKKWPMLFKNGVPMFPIIGDSGKKVASWAFVSRSLPMKRSV
jgi:hypothetical protein